MNGYEMQNRATKASRLAAVLMKCGATDEDVINASEKDWQLCAEAATEMFGTHVNPPNKDNPNPTISLVLSMLAQRRDWEQHSTGSPELMAAIDNIDPFKWTPIEGDKR